MCLSLLEFFFRRLAAILTCFHDSLSKRNVVFVIYCSLLWIFDGTVPAVLLFVFSWTISWIKGDLSKSLECLNFFSSVLIRVRLLMVELRSFFLNLISWMNKFTNKSCVTNIRSGRCERSILKTSCNQANNTELLNPNRPRKFLTFKSIQLDWHSLSNDSKNVSLLFVNHSQYETYYSLIDESW